MFMSGFKRVPQPLGGKEDEIDGQSVRIGDNSERDDSRRTGMDGGLKGMSDISELERRISYALERISAGAARIQSGGGAELAAALESEREVNAQLEARVAAIKERQETQLAAMQAETKELREALLEKDAQLNRMREVNAELRKSNTALREANAAGLADADLVNASMSAELDALRSVAEASRSEIDAVLAQLEPLLDGGARA